MEVDIDTRVAKDVARDLAPCTEPAVSTTSIPLIPHATAGAGEESSATASSAGSPGKGRKRLLYGLTELVCTLHAEPRAIGDVFQADAVCVVWCVTPITEEEDLFILCRVADGARRDLFLFLGVLVEPSEGIEFGNLFLIFDFVGVQEGSCSNPEY